MNESNTELSVVDYQPVSTKQLVAQINAIQGAMRDVMTENVHYGKIPGCGDKPALLKAGAEKLLLLFRLRAEYETLEKDLGNYHREYRIITTIKDASGRTVGQGVGLASTMEVKFRYIGGERKCPECGKSTIIKGKDDYGGGWLCYAKKGGCGHKFKDGDKAIEGQQVGKVENPDVSDKHNTVLKIAKKRSLVDGAITTLAASDIFTQDIDEGVEGEYLDKPKKEPRNITPKPQVDTEAVTQVMERPIRYRVDNITKDQQRYFETIEKDGLPRAVFDERSGVWVAKRDLGPRLKHLIDPVTPFDDDIPFGEEGEAA